MHIFTFCSFKGGTSKTSTSMHIGACLAKFHKKKVLLVDFDSQANLSTGLGIGPDSLKTMVPVLQEQMQIKDVIQESSIKGLYLIPANAYLDGIERTQQLGNDPYAHERLRRALKVVENDFDFCFIDTPPSLGWLTQSAFFASHYSVICTILIGIEICNFAFAKEASSHPTRPGSSFSIVPGAGSDANLSSLALAKLQISIPMSIYQRLTVLLPFEGFVSFKTPSVSITISMFSEWFFLFGMSEELLTKSSSKRLIPHFLI